MIKIAKMATVPLNRIKTIKGNREVSDSHKEQFKRLIQKRGFGGSLKRRSKKSRLLHFRRSA